MLPAKCSKGGLACQRNKVGNDFKINTTILLGMFYMYPYTEKTKVLKICYNYNTRSFSLVISEKDLSNELGEFVLIRFLK